MKNVDCSSGVGLLMDYLEGVLAPDVKAALEAHVAGCPRCQAFFASYRDTPRVLRAATDAALPSHVQESLRAFLRTHTAAAFRPPASGPREGGPHDG
jgi:anti-sigma factor RsiW